VSPTFTPTPLAFFDMLGEVFRVTNEWYLGGYRQSESTVLLGYLVGTNPQTYTEVFLKNLSDKTHGVVVNGTVWFRIDPHQRPSPSRSIRSNLEILESLQPVFGPDTPAFEQVWQRGATR
jgi:hypothetical protein